MKESIVAQPIQETAGYHEGFFDAIDGESLFEGECSPEYEAGWRAYWAVRGMLNEPGFLDTPHAAKLPADAGRHQFNN